MRPVTESLEYLDISSGTSQDFNKLIRSVSYDITNVFNMANENEDTTEKNMSIVVQENLFLQRKIKELEDKLSSIEQSLISKADGEGYNYMSKAFYTADNIEYTEGQLLHDPSYGIVTLPYTNNQKIPLLQFPKEFLIKNIDIRADILGETINITNDPTLLNIIDGDETSFWVTTVDTNNSVDYIDFSITINMPVRILPNLSLNSIGIKPHPMYSMTLKEVRYVSSSNNTEYTLPTFPSEELSSSMQAIDNVRFIFPTVTTTSLIFSFRQPYYIQSGDVRKFVVGIRNIDLENINITNEEASFLTTFKIPGDSRYYLRVLEPTIITLNNEVYGDAVTHELFYDKQSSVPFSFGSDIGADINTVYIKTTIRRSGYSIPAIKGIRLRYLPK